MLGEKIKEKLIESGLSHTDFAKRIGRSRNYAYSILERNEVSTEDLYRISKVLGYNFFAAYHERLRNLPPFQDTTDVKPLLPTEEKLSFLESENDNLKKIIELLEKGDKQ